MPIPIPIPTPRRIRLQSIHLSSYKKTMNFHTPGCAPSRMGDWSHRAVWHIALALLASRLLLAGFAVRLQDYDGPRYLQEALNMIHYGTFSGLQSDHPIPEAHDLPVYPLVLAGLILVFKNLWMVARAAAVLNAIAFTMAAVELYGLVILVGGTKRVAAWAMVLFGLFPENLTYSIVYMPDSMFLAAFLASLLCAARYLIEPRPARLCWAFGLLGVSVMLRPISLFFAAIVIAAICLGYRRRAVLWRPVAVALTSGLLLEAAVCSPWLVRNYLTFGALSVSTITGTNLFWYNYRYMLLDKGMSPEAVDSLLAAQLKRTEQMLGSANNPIILANALQRLVVSEIISDPLAYARTVVKRHPRMYEGTAALELLDMLSTVPHAHGDPLAPVYAKHRALRPLQVLLSALLCLLYSMTIWGTVVLVRRRMWRPLLLAAVPILYFAAIYGPVTSSRYRSAMTPFFAIVAGFAALDKAAGDGTVRRSEAP